MNSADARASGRRITDEPEVTGRTWLMHVLLILATMVILFPVLWLVCASFKQPSDLFSSVLLPWDGLDRLTLDNYRRLLTDQPFARWFINSVTLASTMSVTTVLLSSLGGFALAKYQFAGRGLLMGVMFATMLLPGQMLLPSSYELMRNLGWIDSYLAILVPGAVSVFGMFLFMQSMKGLPDELLDAGRIDGCSELRLWWDVALPTVRPMTGAFTLMTFLGAWNGFLWPQIVLQDAGKYTLPIGLANMVSMPEYQSDYGVLMAGTLLAVLPVVVLFFALQREFVAGLTSGAVKG